MVDPRNDIAKKGATVGSNYLTENLIGVLEFSIVPESHTLTRSIENIYCFLILILFSVFCDIYHVQGRKTYSRGWHGPVVNGIIKNAFPVVWMAVTMVEEYVALLNLPERNTEKPGLNWFVCIPADICSCHKAHPNQKHHILKQLYWHAGVVPSTDHIRHNSWLLCLVGVRLYVD